MQRTRPHQAKTARHSGITTFWVLVSLPVLLIILCVVLEIGNLWMGRVALKNALEAAALSGVKSWGDAGGGNTTPHRSVADDFSSANTVNGTIVSLSAIDATLNDNGGGADVANTTCDGVLVFGVARIVGSEYTFNASNIAANLFACGDGGSLATDLYAVRAQATFEVPCISDDLFGFTIGPFNVTGTADAIYDCATGQARIYHLKDANITCP